MNKYVTQERLLVGSFPRRSPEVMLSHLPAEFYTIHHLLLLRLRHCDGGKYGALL